jgi:hypothetical protein
VTLNLTAIDHRREKPVERVVDNRQEEPLLAAEVVVDRLI